VALLLDDLHWADAASVELIGHLVRRFRGPLLGAFAFRRPPARLAAAFVAAERGGFGSGLRLSPLSADEAQALLGTDLDGAVRARLYRESGGNPFYLEQLARTAQPGARGPVGETDQPSGSWSPPAVVAAAIREELVQLSAEARLALHAAAVAGESFEPELVAAIADRPPSLALGVLDELVEADVIRPSEAPRRFVSGIRSFAPSSIRACRADGGSVLTPEPRQRSRPTKLRRSRTPTMSNGQPGPVTRMRSRCSFTPRARPRLARR
jgi:predicted ATPase